MSIHNCRPALARLGRTSLQPGQRTWPSFQGAYATAISVGKATDPAQFEALIQAACRKYGLDPNLAKAVIKAESDFNPRAVSSAGAKGLMQLMDGTAKSLGVKNSFDPAQNIEGGVRLLAKLQERFASVPLALAAYNAGAGAVEKYGGIPPYQETQRYVPKVLSLWQGYKSSRKV